VKSFNISAGSFMELAHSISHNYGKKCDDNEADFVEKNLNFVKIVAMINANLIISVITVYD
jgi:hypothetical protein